MNFKEYCLLNQKNFDQVKSIEKQVYPSRMQTYQGFDNIEDLLDYADCDGQIDCIVRDDWYAIFCNGTNEVEIIDFASRKPLTFTELIEVKNKLQSFGDKLINMNARESTSYRLIIAAAKRGMFEIISDEPNNEFGEPMHELVLKIKPQKSFKEWFFLQEAIDANTKDLLLKAKAPKDQLDSFIKELEDEPNLIDKKTAFQRFQSKFNIQKKVKDEDAQRKHFASVPNTTEDELKTYDFYKNENPQALKEMMELLRKFIDKKLITLKFENNKPVLIRNTLQGEQKFDTPDFTRFMSSLHGIQASLNQFKSKGNYFNPIEEELNHQPNLVAKGDNVWVFKGHAPDVCRIYGKGHPWCISSSTSATYWFSYRINYHQTQYFVFDYNKDEDDPARYVNPGVAPEGGYSEWVDARNEHSVDPEDTSSQVGINGYRSINQYKKYLASKGIPLDTWKTTPPEEWEKRLNDYNDNGDFQGAKNDDDPRIFPMYLKIVSSIKDSEFETLTEEQKKEFILGKTNISDNQFSYAKEKFKGEYYNSLGLDGKISFAGKTNDQNLLFKLAQNKNLSNFSIYNLLRYATDKDQMAKILGSDNINKLPDEIIHNLLDAATDKDQMAKIIINNKKELSDDNVGDLLQSAKDKDQMAKIIMNNKKELSDMNVGNLIFFATDRDQMEKIIINNKKDLSNSNLYYMFFYSKDKDQLAKRLGSDNINKLSDESIHSLLDDAEDKDQMAKIIIQYKKELSGSNIHNLLRYATDENQMAKLIINNKKELSGDYVYHLLSDATDKEQMAELLQQYTDNISKLSERNIYNLLRYVKDKDQMAKILGSDNIIKLSDISVMYLLDAAEDKDQMAKILGSDNISKLDKSDVSYFLSLTQHKKQMPQILNKYHQKKTPEIKVLIDRHL